MVRYSNENVGNTVAVNISRCSYGKAELTTEFLGLNHLKFRIFEFPYYGESAAADKENLSDVLRRTEPRCTRKISVLKRGSDGEVGNSVTVDIADECDGVAKECGGMFRLRVEQCTRPKCWTKNGESIRVSITRRAHQRMINARGNLLSV